MLLLVMAAALVAVQAETALGEAAPEPPRGWLGLPGTWTSRGELALEGRRFPEDDSPVTEDQALGLFGRLELRHQHGAFDEKARLYGRLDHFDAGRTTFVVEELWLQAQSARLRLRVGADVVNWTATEAFHPADVINARNLDSDLENFEKLGEPMAALSVRLFADTTVTVMFMPYYMSPRFTSPRSRLHFAPPGVDLRGRTLRVDRGGALTGDDFGPQAALHVRQVLGSADVTLHALEQMDRSQPEVVLDPLAGAPALLFRTVRQVGGTYQQVFGPLIAKLEGAYRSFVELDEAATARLGPRPPRDHGAVAVGFEYGLPHASGPESTFILEGQALIGDLDEVTRVGLSPFQRDVLVGYRLALGDESGRELMVGAIFDLERGDEYLVNLSYQQRLGETWTIRGGLRPFQADERPTPPASPPCAPATTSA